MPTNEGPSSPSHLHRGWDATLKNRARRDDAWKRVAAWLTDRFSYTVVDEFNLAALARVPDVGTENTAHARAARALRTIAAPGALRSAISNAARQRGTTIYTGPAASKGTVVHFACGGDNARDQRYAKTAVVACASAATPTTKIQAPARPLSRRDRRRRRGAVSISSATRCTHTILSKPRNLARHT
jgi:hypothetical protein